MMREWRSTWTVNSLVRAKRQGQVLGFLWFCERAGWLPRNHASDITKGLGKIRVKPIQTGYFTPSEYKAILDTTYLYSDRPSVDKHNEVTLGGDRIRALTELMRWTGLRIRDAVTLEKNRLQYDPQSNLWSVIVYQKKTGDPVYCPIPPHVAEMLINVPASQKGNSNETYFFWTGQTEDDCVQLAAQLHKAFRTGGSERIRRRAEALVSPHAAGHLCSGSASFRHAPRGGVHYSGSFLSEGHGETLHALGPRPAVQSQPLRGSILDQTGHREIAPRIARPESLKENTKGAGTGSGARRSRLTS